MDRDAGPHGTGPSGTLVQRVADHVAAVDRVIRQSNGVIEAVRAQMRQSNRRVQRTFHRVRDSGGAARAAQRSTTEAEQRYLRAKRRELAAHERALKRHDEAAVLQERLGHPERAASAREHGRHTRELHEQALQELHDWAGADTRRQGFAALGP